MYDPARRIGRYGYEVQTLLLVHPSALKFDPKAKKLGTRLDPAEFVPTHPMPKGWYWVADPCAKRAYVPDPDPPPGDKAEWFLTDHHAKFAQSTGYQTYWVYKEEDFVCFQAELVSEPMDDSVSAQTFADDIRSIYRVCLAEMLEKGIVAPFERNKQQQIKEQLNLEIDDVAWTERVDPLDKLSWLAAGMYLLTRFSDRLSPPEAHQAALIEHFRSDILASRRMLARYDLFTNYGLLLDGYLFGEAFDFETLSRFVRGRAHTAILATEFDNDICPHYVHGYAELSASDLEHLRMDDFDLFRSLGIDSTWLDVLVGLPQDHIDHQRRIQRIPFMREALGHFLHVEELSAFLMAGVMDGTPPLPSMKVPLFHPRKTATSGCVYLELRNVASIKTLKVPRYIQQFMPVDDPNGELQVIYMGHMRNLATDIAELFDVAILAGERLVQAIQDGHPAIRSRDADAFDTHFLGHLQWLLNSYRRPPWRREDMVE